MSSQNIDETSEIRGVGPGEKWKTGPLGDGQGDDREFEVIDKKQCRVCRGTVREPGYLPSV